MTNIDISEEQLANESAKLLSILLKDRTTNKSIVWATHSYEYLGRGFGVADSITPKKVMGAYASLIQPRSEKSKEEQKDRTKVRAEVYTPTWLVKLQNAEVEDDLSNLSLEAYVDTKWLEITCGEAPYMVNRYDTVTGEEVPLAERVGFVDRKMQRISREVADEEDFFKLATRAYRSSYGYEYQGDSLLLARENLLATFEDYYQAAFAKSPTLEQKMEIATIISYNVFQMDGLAKITPYSVTTPKFVQLDLFGEISDESPVPEAKQTKLKDWKTRKMIGFESLSSEESEMKFDVVIGNPPYQDTTLGENVSFAPPIYHDFIDEAIKVSDKAVLITPGRFLFNAGGTPKVWNKKILNSRHVKVVHYEQDSSKIFPGTDIKGGVAVTYQDKSREFEPINTYTPFEELNEILHLVSKKNLESFSKLVSGRGVYKLSKKALEKHPEIESLQSKGHTYDVGSGAFKILKDIIFFEEKTENSISFLGLTKLKRTYLFAEEEDFVLPEHFYKYKIFIPKSNGSGALGEVLSTPLIGATETFLSIGSFDTLEEAEFCMKFIKTKFARAMLGILKITQDNTRDKWSKVPLFDFKSISVIDWTQSIAEIDNQLYRFFNLEPHHIAFIESKVREME